MTLSYTTIINIELARAKILLNKAATDTQINRNVPSVLMGFSCVRRSRTSRRSSETGTILKVLSFSFFNSLAEWDVYFRSSFKRTSIYEMDFKK